MPYKKRRLTALEFDVLLPFLAGNSKNQIQAARSALVDGLTMQAVADRYGWTRQAVNSAVSVVWRVRGQYLESERIKSEMIKTELPEGWKQIIVTGPGDEIDELEKLWAQNKP